MNYVGPCYESQKENIYAVGNIGTNTKISNCCDKPYLHFTFSPSGGFMGELGTHSAVCEF